MYDLEKMQITSDGESLTYFRAPIEFEVDGIVYHDLDNQTRGNHSRRMFEMVDDSYVGGYDYYLSEDFELDEEKWFKEGKIVNKLYN